MQIITGVITNDESFYNQIATLFSYDMVGCTFKHIPVGGELDTYMYITDGEDNRVYDEGVPIFIIAKSCPAGIEESANLRFYKSGSFSPSTFAKDIKTWTSFLSELLEVDEECQRLNTLNEKLKIKLTDYDKYLKQAKLLQQKVCENLKAKDFQFSTYYRSFQGLSGDFCLAESIGEKVFIIIGDVTNHGSMAGLYATSIHSILKSYFMMASKFEMNVESIVRYARYAASAYQCNEPQLRQSLSATVLFCEINKEEEKIRFISCGHSNERPILISPDGDVTHVNFADAPYANITPIGDFSNMEPRGCYELPFKKGSGLILYTDGLTEIFSKTTETKAIQFEYSSERLEASVNDFANKNTSNWATEDLLTYIKNDISSYSAGQVDIFHGESSLNSLAKEDDITTIVAKWI